MRKFFLASSIILLGLLFPGQLASAQEAQPDGPVYIVQPGDTLWGIAQRFGVTMDELAGANGILDPGQIAEGDALEIPGLEGIQGVLVTQTLPFGENLRSLSRRYRVPVEILARLNHLSAPSELYAGYNLVVPENSASSQSFGRLSLAAGQSLLELAVLENANPWSFVTANVLAGTWSPIPGDILLLPGDHPDGPGGLPGALVSVDVEPFPMLQGRTTVIRLEAQSDVALSGSWMGSELHFFQDRDQAYVALQGVYALQEPGLYPLQISGEVAGGAAFSYSQRVMVLSSNYPYDQPLTVDPATIDPAVTRPEDAQWNALAGPISSEKLWDGAFQMPSPLPKDYCLESNECWTSRYGNRRSYNGSPYNYFHTGLDIAGGTGTEIYAPADGVVVFAGPLTVRGNATMIDHGWGIYSGYMHQSEILVEVGQRIDAGQLIGLVGGTGRVQGPHLHWEIWAGGVQVDPLEWLEKTFP